MNRVIFTLICGLISQPAFSQGGKGANGPHQQVQLIPASGETETLKAKLYGAIEVCSVQSVNEMLTPFLGVAQPNPDLSGGPSSNSIYYHTSFMTRSFSQEFRVAYQTNSLAYIQISIGISYRPLTAHQYLSATLTFHGFPTLPANPDHHKEMSLAIPLPVFHYAEYTKPMIEPVTRASLGARPYVTQITAVWSPKDSNRSALTVYNWNQVSQPDLESPTNFRMNGEKYVECVRSRL